MVAAPGSGAGATAALVAHAERVRHRIALLDGDPGMDDHAVRALRDGVDSSRAVVLHPWLLADDPAGGPAPVPVAPSGFVAGAWARPDGRARGNERLTGAVALERRMGTAAAGELAERGVTALRDDPGRGLRIGSARTASSDPEWRYVAVRRLLILLEHSLERGTQWAAFEPNDERLWSAVRRCAEDFLLGQWRSGALAGPSPRARRASCAATPRR